MASTEARECFISPALSGPCSDLAPIFLTSSFTVIELTKAMLNTLPLALSFSTANMQKENSTT